MLHKCLRGVAAASLLLLLAGEIAGAAEPSVEYSANSALETEDGRIVSRVHRAPGRERMEMSMPEPQIVIRRDDKKVVWILMPSDQMYLETAAGAGGPASDRDYRMVEQTVVGEETLDGVATTKRKVVMTDAKGRKFAGFWWDTKDGITVKMDAISVDEGGKHRIKMELTNLQVGRQDPGLFEIPAGYEKLAMPSMPGMEEMMKGMR